MWKRFFPARGMKIRIHPLFLVLMASAFVSGLFTQAVILFAIVIIHELGHVCVALSIGYRVKEMELLPFGGVARLEHGTLGWSPRDETAIAIAGPINNLLLVMIGLLLYAAHFWNETMTVFFIKGNLIIAFFNLIPALPLDGGRILRAALSRQYGFRQATEVAIKMSFAFSAFLVLIGILAIAAGQINAAVIVLGIFLAVSAIQLRRQLRFDAVRFLDAKRRVRPRVPMPVRVIAAPSHVSVSDVVQQFAPDCYHLIYVLDDAHRVIDIMEEEELVKVAFNGNSYAARLIDAIMATPKK